MSTTIAFMNMKGGVGKTTMAVNIAYCLAEKHQKKTLLLDLDPQMNATEYCLSQDNLIHLLSGETVGSVFQELSTRKNFIQSAMSQILRPQKKRLETSVNGIQNVLGNLYLLPSHLQLWELDIRENKDVVKKLIDDVEEEYDYIIIDAPPTLSPFTHAALLAADYYVIPVKMDVLSVWGLEFFQTWVQNIIPPRGVEVAELLGIAPNMVNLRRIAETYAIERFQDNKYHEYLFETHIRNRADVQNALVSALNDQDIAHRFIINRKDDILPQQFMDLTNEVVERIESLQNEEDAVV